jgi:hypothetical protein
LGAAMSAHIRDRSQSPERATKRGRRPNLINQVAQQAAHAAGEIHYNGMPCPKGHTKRYTRTGTCVECSAVAMKKRYDRFRRPAHKLDVLAMMARNLVAEIERAQIEREGYR